jgi:hypothetical protein
MALSNTTYQDFIEAKSQSDLSSGFEPVFNPDWLYDFQHALVEWSTIQGRSAIFADCGLGKTPMQLAWAENVCRKTNGRVLILTPLAVSAQTVQEGEKFEVDCLQSREGKVMPRVTVTNYERLHYFRPEDFAGVVLDESSAIKHFTGARQKGITRFMAKTPYRLLCTATAAPNDYVELGTSAEALGHLGYMDMLSRFFKSEEKTHHRVWGIRMKWRFKKHAEQRFWRWVSSWARAMRKPSDMGFDDTRFILPPLTVNETVVKHSFTRSGEMFHSPAVTLEDQREERRETIQERCEKVAELVDHDQPAVAWCHLNAEGDLLEKLIPDAEQVKGADKDDEKEAKLLAFARGDIRILVTKPKIGAFGLNWQHCAHATLFPSHSYEQYYQCIRRNWRFGQTRPVVVDLVTTEGERGVVANMKRKEVMADKMFSALVKEMHNALEIARTSGAHLATEVPQWL